MEEVENKEEPKAQSEEGILKWFFFIAGAIFVAIFIWIFIGNSGNSFEYKSLQFNIVDEIAPYRTSLPSAAKDEITGAVIYNDFFMYLRKDPRILEQNIPFEGDIESRNTVVFKSSEEFNCEGKGVVGVMNLVRVYDLLGVDVKKDPDAPCDPTGSQYTVLEIFGGEETRIDKVGPSCYQIQVKDCEILEATERYLVEVLASVKSDLDSKNGS